MLVWTSSSATDQGKWPAAISARIWPSPFSIAARSVLLMIPVACSMREWAIDASMSNAARRRSNAIDAVKRCASSLVGSLNLPDHSGLSVLSLAGMRPARIWLDETSR